MPNRKKFLNQLHGIDMVKPRDLIINQLKILIMDGVLKPGDVLPSERKLCERFGVGRGQVREAIQRLEFFGIVETIPQSGTRIASLGIKTLQGLVSNIIELEKDDFLALFETRCFLEVFATRLTTRRASQDDFKHLIATHNEFESCVQAGESGLEEDLLFHLRISELCGNSSLHSLISYITPDVLRFSKKHSTCRDGRFYKALQEHKTILDALITRNEEMAAQAMRDHLDKTLEQLNSLARIWQAQQFSLTGRF
ncbi:FCD domain-containing protein [candidate division KSB1 bacterium]|nr:FCD domain-containing protein [candidate division KSB1 bacterium]